MAHTVETGREKCEGVLVRVILYVPVIFRSSDLERQAEKTLTTQRFALSGTSQIPCFTDSVSTEMSLFLTHFPPTPPI